jgi:hypothetical protein
MGCSDVLTIDKLSNLSFCLLNYRVRYLCNYVNKTKLVQGVVVGQLVIKAKTLRLIYVYKINVQQRLSCRNHRNVIKLNLSKREKKGGES